MIIIARAILQKWEMPRQNLAPKDLRFLNPRLLQGHPSPEFAASELAAAGAKAGPRGRGRFKNCVVADREALESI